MSDRETILGRIREALSVKAPLPGVTGGSCSVPGGVPGAASVSGGVNARQWLPSVPSDVAGQWDLFRKNAEMLRASFQLFATQEEMLQHLERLSQEESWKKVGSHKGALTETACARLKVPVCLTVRGYDAMELEGCDAGITECDALVAQTGSALVTSRSAGGRALSVLPPHHVILARASQLVADLPAAFQMLESRYGGNYPSLISFITGPSRTGDIERILVLGAHGPKKLTILCTAD